MAGAIGFVPLSVLGCGQAVLGADGSQADAIVRQGVSAGGRRGGARR